MAASYKMRSSNQKTRNSKEIAHPTGIVNWAKHISESMQSRGILSLIKRSGSCITLEKILILRF